MSAILCQHTTQRERSAPSGAPQHVTTPCPNEVTGTYRQCGVGCKAVYAYCTVHGGDERAAREMREHHATHEVKP